MNKHEKIVEGLRRIAREHGSDYILDGTVVAVDSEAYMCDVLLDSDGSTLFDCRLRATATGTKSIDVLPVVGSAIVIAKMGSEEYLMLACDEVTSHRVTIGNMQILVDDNGIGLSNGGDSLKSILTDFVNGLLSVYAPKDVAGITALLERINGLLQ